MRRHLSLARVSQLEERVKPSKLKTLFVNVISPKSSYGNIVTDEILGYEVRRDPEMGYAKVMREEGESEEELQERCKELHPNIRAWFSINP